MISNDQNLNPYEKDYFGSRNKTARRPNEDTTVQNQTQLFSQTRFSHHRRREGSLLIILNLSGETAKHHVAFFEIPSLELQTRGEIPGHETTVQTMEYFI